MIKLYDWLSQDSLDLDYSLNQAGFSGQTIVINENGFLPEGMTSPYAYFCGFEKAENSRPLYFNELPVPDFWQIAGNNSQGEVFNYSEKKATIFYAEPKHLRYIQNVDWLGADGKARFTDHYNQYGWRFARTQFTGNQEATVKTYFNQEGQEILVENFKTGTIILNWKDKVHFFKNRVELLDFYFDLLAFDTSAIWFNSLSTPFFLSRYIGGAGNDVLFWQEGIGDAIPRNMQSIFNHPEDRVKRIIVQRKDAYDKLLSLLPSAQHERVHYLGYTYPEKKQPTGKKDILILTNSDQIEHLEDLVVGLSNFTFHIGALTEMSQRLTSFSRYDNVVLYPNLPAQKAHELFEKCDLYFDINHGSSILDSVRQAFEYNQIIFAYNNTSHDRDLTLPAHIFAPEETQRLIDTVRGLGDHAQVARQQREETIFESSDTYRKVLC